MELSAKEIHVLESFNQFIGTNLTLNSDIALISVREKMLCIIGLKTGLKPIQECPLVTEWCTRALENKQDIRPTFTRGLSEAKVYREREWFRVPTKDLKCSVSSSWTLVCLDYTTFAVIEWETGRSKDRMTNTCRDLDRQTDRQTDRQRNATDTHKDIIIICGCFTYTDPFPHPL